MKPSLAILIAINVILTGCVYTGEHVSGNGKRTTQKRTVGNAEKIDIAGEMDVILDVGPTSIRVEGDENILRYITTQTNDDGLRIAVEDDVDISAEEPIRVYVSSPRFRHVSVTGSGNVSSLQSIESDEPMVCAVTGSGNLKMALHAPRVRADITGSGNINLRGEARDVDVSVTGSGDFNAMDLRAESARVNITGSGNVSVFANANLKADIHGSGDVKYKGNAQVQETIGGSGTVQKVE